MQVTNHPKAERLCLTPTEREILAKADIIIDNLQVAFGNETTITGLETGEIIEPGELKRVRGILDFFYTHSMIEVH